MKNRKRQRWEYLRQHMPQAAEMLLALKAAGMQAVDVRVEALGDKMSAGGVTVGAEVWSSTRCYWDE